MSTEATWAERNARCLLRDDEQQLAHVCGVATRAQVMSELAGTATPVLVAAAWLHDIGYAAALRHTGLHSIDGARYVRRRGDTRVAALVAHHSFSAYEAYIRGLGAQIERFENEKSIVTDLLAYCDLTTAPDGAATTLDDRLASVMSRYTPEHPTRRALHAAEGGIREMAVRVELAIARSALRPSTALRRVGVEQEGAEVLSAKSEPFALPRERDAAGAVERRLRATLRRVRAVHVLRGAVALSAPQVGVPRAAAAVSRPGLDPLVLFNARVVGESADADVDYEASLSLYDVRGRVKRPRWLEIEHTMLDGKKERARFEGDDARAWAQAVDHLHGVLYPDRMDAPDVLVPVESAEGAPWRC
jgi:peptide deformylase